MKLFYQKRKAFTQNTISNALSQYPKYNWVVCHSPYSVAFDGVQGTDWGQTHYELGITFHRTIGSVFLIYFQYFVSFFLMILKTGTIFFGQNLEHSIDMATVDLSMYVPRPHLSNL